MNSVFKAVKISDHVYWVGAVDWGIRDFHGYATNRGTTYNAFLILADKVTLIDTVKRPFMDEMLSRIASVVEPEKIDYIVVNHGELDHSGSLPQVIERVKPSKVFTSSKGPKCLDSHFHLDREFTVIEKGEDLSLGNLTLGFQETAMLHWPESMFTILREDSVLFSQDAFGMHLATSSIFADEIPEPVLEYEAAKYFANILLPYAPRIRKLLDNAAELTQGITMIAPDHGPLWRINPEVIVSYYVRWTAQKPTNKAVVVYETMWESTATMARAVGEGLISEKCMIKLLPIRCTHRSDIATEILDAGGLVVGSPTLNNNMFPSVADVMYYLKGLRPANKIGGAFGSYGWSSEGVKQVAALLGEMKIELPGENVAVNYVPDNDALAQCHALGACVGKRLNEMLEDRKGEDHGQIHL